MSTLVIVIIVLALVFDYINGFHDAANSIATVVSTKVLTPLQAVLWAALFNFVAFFIFKDHAVANTIAKTVIDNYITLPVILAGLVAAIFWNLLTWWYGIPSSSSHTLIGGFAGAALAHAYYVKGWIPLGDVVEMDKITKTVYFIFLAPLIGMLISIFITLVTIRRNVYGRLVLITLSAVGMWFLFGTFRITKLEENLTKFYKLDKYKKELAKHPDDEAVVKKYEKAVANYELSKPYLKNFDAEGADKIADEITAVVDVKYLEESKIKDVVSKKLKIDKLKKDAFYDERLQPLCDAASVTLDDCKPIIKDYHIVGVDSTAKALTLKLGMEKIGDYEKFTKSLTVDAKKDLKKELVKADNRTLLYCIFCVIGMFMLSYIYCELIQKPTANRMANMFKKLQLLSSAAFSIGHGGNDAQKVMGIIGAALIANGTIAEFKDLPNWVPLACYAAIGLGTMSGGWKIIKTMGTKITKVTPLEGVSAETAGAITLFMTEQMGIPVSTTHTITGSIIGVGATKRLSAVRWGVTRSLLIAWIITIPISALVAGLTYLLLGAMGVS
ncbi:MAG: phosphate transporter [Flavobacteriales bacterium]|nr:MAG: phosphate transporter [Flavobacteriales bacterium]